MLFMDGATKCLLAITSYLGACLVYLFIQPRIYRHLSKVTSNLENLKAWPAVHVIKRIL